MKKNTQNQRILDNMIQFGSITPFDAMRDLGVMRLASRVTDLKRAGHLISSNIETGENRFGEATRYARYTLVQEAVS